MFRKVPSNIAQKFITDVLDQHSTLSNNHDNLTRPESLNKMIHQSCIESARETIETKRRQTYQDLEFNRTVKCAVSGVKLKSGDNFDVIHYPITFDRMVLAFTEQLTELKNPIVISESDIVNNTKSSNSKFSNIMLSEL